MLLQAFSVQSKRVIVFCLCQLLLRIQFPCHEIFQIPSGNEIDLSKSVSSIELNILGRFKTTIIVLC